MSDLQKELEIARKKRKIFTRASNGKVRDIKPIRLKLKDFIGFPKIK